jgi:hypothetical protein
MSKLDDLHADARPVLEVIRDQALDGYALMSRTGLGFDQLKAAVTALVRSKLVAVTGSLDRERFGDSMFSVPIDAVGDADVALDRLTPKTSYR